MAIRDGRFIVNLPLNSIQTSENMSKLYCFYIGTIPEYWRMGSYFTVGGYERLNKKSFSFEELANSITSISKSNMSRIKGLKPGNSLRISTLSGDGNPLYLWIKSLNEDDINSIDAFTQLNQNISSLQEEVIKLNIELQKYELFRQKMELEGKILALKKERDVMRQELKV